MTRRSCQQDINVTLVNDLIAVWCRGRLRGSTVALILIGLAPVFPPGLAGQASPVSADTLRLSDAVALARTGNPMLRAARLRADAATERVPQAGALPDPELSLGLMNRMAGNLRSTMDPMTMNQVQLTQMFPWPGVLGFAEQRAQRLADAERLDADEA